MKNTQITLNNKTIFLSEDFRGELTLEFFDLFYRYSKELILNDDGGKFKAKLRKFDMSEDKKFGNDWHFIVNEKSRALLSEVLREYSQKTWGLFRWSLIGKDFRIDYQDVSDEMVFPEYKKKGIFNLFTIKAKGKSLGLIKELLNTNVFDK